MILITLLWPPKARPLYFTAVIYFFICFYFVSIDERPAMGSQVNQTWPVGRKWCRFTNAPQKFRGPSPNLGRKNIKFWITFSATSALDTAYLISGTKRRIDKQNYYCQSTMCPFKGTGPTFRDLWPQNGWDLFAYCDPPFGGHYVVTIKVATSLGLFVLHPWTPKRLKIYPHIPTCVLLYRACVCIWAWSP